MLPCCPFFFLYILYIMSFAQINSAPGNPYPFESGTPAARISQLIVNPAVGPAFTTVLTLPVTALPGYYCITGQVDTIYTTPANQWIGLQIIHDGITILKQLSISDQLGQAFTFTAFYTHVNQPLIIQLGCQSGQIQGIRINAINIKTIS